MVLGARLLLLLLRVGLLTAAIVVVVVLVRLQSLFAQFLLALVDVAVQLVPVLSNRELLIVVNRNHNLTRAHWLIISVVELGNVGVSESLLGRQSLIRVKLQQRLQHIQSLIGSSWENVSQTAHLRRRQTFQHSLCQG